MVGLLAQSPLGAASDGNALAHLLDFLPNLLVAMATVAVGLLAAGVLRRVVAAGARRVGLSYGAALAAGCYYVLAVMVFIAALGQLRIEFVLLNYAILIVLAGASLAGGLAFGLGGRDVVAGILAGLYLRQRFHPGDQVRVGEIEGTLREVGVLATVIETEEEGLIHRRTVPNSLMLKEAVR